MEPRTLRRRAHAPGGEGRIRATRSRAGLLLVPYALWIAFATALTWAIWARN